MAIKDWKKRPKTEWQYGTKDAIAYQRRGFYLVIFPNYINKTWDVNVNDRKQGQFKTKSQALKFAKQYMRTH